MFDNSWIGDESMTSQRGYKDYSEMRDGLTICTCKGVIKPDKPICELNLREEMSSTGKGRCLYFKTNGTEHCDHPPKPW